MCAETSTRVGANLDRIRQQFPSLDRDAVFFDNPGGTQISKQSLARMNSYLLENNANHEGAFETSRRSDETLHEADRRLAAFSARAHHRKR